ncbi:phosphotransferase, partial [Rhodococcus sp. DMU2021]|nr:phosphotransferase [Rhodococcus sp. DMU2021]
MGGRRRKGDAGTRSGRHCHGPAAPVVGARMSRGRHAERELTALDSLPHLTRAVVHGDLGAENVLWEWSHGLPHLSGVLDWDDVTL